MDHLFAASDDDHDNRLSFDEILEHYDTFVGSEATDYGDYLHDIERFADELWKKILERIANKLTNRRRVLRGRCLKAFLIFFDGCLLSFIYYLFMFLYIFGN